ncbi:MAG TPA: isopentenyl-diphosphate Delta-isomerase [Bacteroidetes bacterium]|nr:isopentenyl-diphosphate Delta-isomerase [Bacteroidota bacterium]
MSNNKIVSFEDEKLIVVNENDRVLSYRSKAECHNGDGILHRAFSIFIFNDKMQLLIQKRAEQKRLWPLYWANSCCSHPRKGENFTGATQRRLYEEVGIKTPLKYLFKFQYTAKYKNEGAENELCSVFVGKSNDRAIVNNNEIVEWKFIDIPELEKEFESHPENYTPWFKMEWEKIRSDHLQEIERI